MADEKNKMVNGEIYNPECDELVKARHRAKELCIKYNQLLPTQKTEKENILKSLLAKYGNSPHIEPNFFCDYGFNIEFDGFVYINHNSVFLDCAKIKTWYNQRKQLMYPQYIQLKRKNELKGLKVQNP